MIKQLAMLLFLALTLGPALSACDAPDGDDAEVGEEVDD
jgi:hypothetical protein